jgi:hypothetical protein
MSLGSLLGLVPIVRVEDVVRSVEFYRRLGFVMRNKLEREGRLVWAWLDSGKAYLMVSHSQGPMTPAVRDVILYLYASDLVAYLAKRTKCRSKCYCLASTSSRSRSIVSATSPC